MSCSRSVVLPNNALKIAVMKNGDLSLIQLGLDKEKCDITESVIAIYQSELNLLSDVVSYCADEFKKLNDKRNW